MRYHDFDLSIEQGVGQTIVVRSRCQAHGEYRDQAPLELAQLARELDVLANDEVQRATLIAVGTSLYAHTFGASKREIEWHFAQCWGAATSTEEGVRIRLRIDAPALATIPWEYIYSERLRSFFGVLERTPIVRYLELPRGIASLEATLPIRMLLVIPEQPELQSDVEEAEIRKALVSLGDAIEVRALRGNVTRRTIADALTEDAYHVLHFIGHGDFDGERATLVLKREDGGDDLVDHERMAALFRNHPSMKLMVLNSCRGAQLSASKPLLGMGAELVRSGVPAVIAMQFEIADAEAVCFARAFYRTLFLGRDKGRIDIAVSHARNELESEFDNTRAVGLPVLFTHAPEGVLFNLEEGNPLRDLSSRSADRLKAVIRTHEHNLETMRSAAPTDAQHTERNALERVRQRLRFRNWSIVIAVAVALVVALGATFFGVETRYPLFRPESYFVAFSDLFHHHERESSVLLVHVDSTALRVLGPTTPAWRGRNAVVLNRLVAAGAPVVAFNLTFAPNAGSVAAQTDSLADALRNAAEHGTTVLGVVDSASSGGIAAEPQLVPLMHWGTNCADTAQLTAPIMTLAVGGRGVTAREREPSRSRVQSLPLAAVSAFHRALSAPADARAVPRGDARGDERREMPAGDVAELDDLLRRVTLDRKIAGRDDARCLIAAGDTLFRMAIDYAPAHEHREAGHQLSYLDLLSSAPLRDLRRTLVLVGYDHATAPFPIVRGWNAEQRSGLEVTEDAMNTVLRGIRIAPLGLFSQYLVILVMASLGAFVVFLRPRTGQVVAAAVLVGGVVAYFVGGALLYAYQHSLLNTTFDLAALGLSLVAVGLCQRVWFQ